MANLAGGVYTTARLLELPLLPEQIPLFYRTATVRLYHNGCLVFSTEPSATEFYFLNVNFAGDVETSAPNSPLLFSNVGALHILRELSFKDDCSINSIDTTSGKLVVQFTSAWLEFVPDTANETKQQSPLAVWQLSPSSGTDQVEIVNNTSDLSLEPNLEHQINTRGRQFRCPHDDCKSAIPGNGFTTDLDLFRHLSCAHIQYPCPESPCDMMITQYTKETHLRKSNNLGKRFPCHIDGCKYASYENGHLSNANLIKHVSEVHHDEKTQCTYDGCTEQLKSGTMTEHNIRKHRQDLQHMCPVDGCVYAQPGLGFTSQSKFNRHMRTHGALQPVPA